MGSAWDVLRVTTIACPQAARACCGWKTYQRAKNGNPPPDARARCPGSALDAGKALRIDGQAQQSGRHPKCATAGLCSSSSSNAGILPCLGPATKQVRRLTVIFCALSAPVRLDETSAKGTVRVVASGSPVPWTMCCLPLHGAQRSLAMWCSVAPAAAGLRSRRGGRGRAPRSSLPEEAG